MKTFLTATFAFVMLVVTSFADIQTTLEWQASPSPEVSKYKLLVGKASGQYTESVEVGKVTQGVINTADNGDLIYVVCVAVSDVGDESAPSNEIVFRSTKVRPPLSAPQGFRIIKQISVP